MLLMSHLAKPKGVEVSVTITSLCRRTIYDDPFIRNYIEDLLKNIRTQVHQSTVP